MNDSWNPLLMLLSGLLVLVVHGCARGEADAMGGIEHHAPGDRDLDEGESREASDLDLSVGQLLALECEHGIRTYLCDECRYEVGVVRVPEDLIGEGMLETRPVKALGFGVPMELTGEIQLNDQKTVHLGTRVAGVVTRTLVDIGQSVEASQVLFEIDSIELGEAEMDYVESQVQLSIAKKNHDRQKKLLAAGVTSEKEYLEAKGAFSQARVANDTAKKKLLLLGLSARDVKNIAKKVKGDSFGRLQARAPQAGTVISMHAPAGELLDPGDEVITISDLSSLWLWVDVYEDDLAEMIEHQRSEDLKATVEVQAWPGEEFPGEVDLVGVLMDETTRTVKARIAIPNPDGRLRPGMFGRVRITTPGGDVSLATLRAAVQSDEGDQFVFVHLEGEYYIRRKVETGRRAGDLVEILSGIEEGQTVVVKGAFLLKSDVLRSKMGAGCAD